MTTATKFSRENDADSRGRTTVLVVRKSRPRSRTRFRI